MKKITTSSVTTYKGAFITKFDVFF